jgi:hypothetical protein
LIKDKHEDSPVFLVSAGQRKSPFSIMGILSILSDNASCKFNRPGCQLFTLNTQIATGYSNELVYYYSRYQALRDPFEPIIT